ncbi:MAG: phenylalanine--tRNA ligase subunit beta, partial [archaeon]
MAKIEIYYEDLCELLGKDIGKMEVEKALTESGFPTEDKKEFLEVEVFPNRPDCLSVEGLARHLRSWFGLREKKIKIKKSKLEYFCENVGIRPYFRCSIVRNCEMSDSLIKSLMQVQEKMHETVGRKRKKVAIGIHDLKNIKFPIKYCEEDKNASFVPLGFAEKMSLEEILKKHPKGIEYSWILAGAEKYPVVKDSENKILSFPPIINSELTRVKEDTKDLLIDVTGTDEKTVAQVLTILEYLFAERGAEIERLLMNGKYVGLEDFEIELKLEDAEKRIGIKITPEKAKEALRKMGIKAKGSKILKCKIPAYRTDFFGSCDLIEDLAIGFGYSNIHPKYPEIFSFGNIKTLENEWINLLVGFGLQQVITYMISNEEKLFKSMGIKNEAVVKITNPNNKEKTCVRNWLLPGLLDILSKNKNEKYPQNIFEVGDVLVKEGGEFKQRKKVCIVLCNKDADYSAIKSYADAILREIKKENHYEKINLDFLVPGRQAKFLEGFIGEIHPKILQRFK